MRIILFLLFALCAASRATAQTAPEITGVLWITNVPAGLTTNLTANAGTADTRWFTNNASASNNILIQITNTIPATRTNIVRHFDHNTGSPIYTAGLGSHSVFVWLNPTNTACVNFTAPDYTNLTLTAAGTWARVAYYTNFYATSVPIQNRTNAMSHRERTNAVNAIINFLASMASAIPTNQLPSGLPGFTNLLDQTSYQTSSHKTFTSPTNNGGLIDGAYLVNIVNFSGSGGTISGIYLIGVSNLSGFIGSLTNGTLYSNVLAFPRITNGNYHGTIQILSNGTLANVFITNAPSVHATNLVAGAGRFTALTADSLTTTGAVNWGSLYLGNTSSGLSGAWALRQNLGVFGEYFQIFNDDALSAVYSASYDGALIRTWIGNGPSDSLTTNWGLFYSLNYAGSNATFANITAETNFVATNVMVRNIATTDNSTNAFRGANHFPRATYNGVNNAGAHNVIELGNTTWVDVTGAATADGWPLGGLTNANANGRLVWLRNLTGYEGTIWSDDGSVHVANQIRTLTRTNTSWPNGSFFPAIYDPSSTEWVMMFPPITILTASATNAVDRGENLGLTNATHIGIFYQVQGTTNIQFRTVQAGNGIVNTNEGTNIVTAIDPAVVASQANLTTVSNYVTAATNSASVTNWIGSRQPAHVVLSNAVGTGIITNTAPGATNYALNNWTNYSQVSWNTNTLNEGTDGVIGGYVSSNFISFSATNPCVLFLAPTNNQVWFFVTNISFTGVRYVEVGVAPQHFNQATNRQVIFPSTFKMMSGGYTNTLWSNRTAIVRLRVHGDSMSAVSAWYEPENL